MGILKQLFKKANTFIENNNKVEQEEIKNDSDDDLKNKLFYGGKDYYNKEQVIALFLNSMSYRPHIIGKDNDDYPRYMQYDYKILNVPKFHKELIDEGYFVVAAFEKVISKCKVDELKRMLCLYDVDTKGLKKEALLSLVNEKTNSDLKDEIVKQSGLYELSKKGLDYLETNKEFLTVVNDFKKFEISYSLFTEYRKKLPSYLNTRDVAWKILNEKLNYYTIHNSFASARTIYLYMAEFLQEEKTNIDVLYYYIVCLYYDVNLPYIQERLMDEYSSKEMILEYIDTNTFAPGIYKAIYELSCYHDDKIYDKLFSYQLMPYKFISDDDFKKMVSDIYNSSFFESDKYVNDIIANAKKIIEDKAVKQTKYRKY